MKQQEVIPSNKDIFQQNLAHIPKKASCLSYHNIVRINCFELDRASKF